MALYKEHCDACKPGMPHVTEEEAASLAKEIEPGWDRYGVRKICRRVETDDFATALTLAVRIGLIAENEGHHPDLSLSWGSLTVDLTTHAAKGLTRNDFVMAAKIDRVLGS